MAIVIKDLPGSVDLDRQAMIATTGGARASGRQTLLGRTIFHSARTINYPTSFAYRPLADVNGQSAENRPHK